MGDRNRWDFRRDPERAFVCPLLDRENSPVLLDYVSRRLDPEVAEQLERHMAQCPACAEFASAQQAVWRALDSWEAMEPSPSFDRDLFARIDDEASRGWVERVFGRLPHAVGFVWRPALPLAAACLLLVAGALMQPGSDIDQAAPVRAETLDIEMVERTLEDMDMLLQLTPAVEVTGQRAERQTL
jgi:anti-sigma factor RsiW